MKRIVFVLALIAASVCFAQKDVTKFLGIPVDGSKGVMVNKIEAKGFTYNFRSHTLVGEFNGENVALRIQTVNGKVWRIIVIPTDNYDEAQVKTRFNRLCRQFERNPKYASLFGTRSQEIGEDEDISYEMTVRSKQYQAAYFQDGDDMKIVWFAISETYGIYYITMYYENTYNEASGEDL